MRMSSTARAPPATEMAKRPFSENRLRRATGTMSDAPQGAGRALAGAPSMSLTMSRNRLSTRRVDRPAFCTLPTVSRLMLAPCSRTETGLTQSIRRPSTGRPQRAPHLLEAEHRVRHGAEDAGGDHDVERAAGEGERLRVHQRQLHVDASFAHPADGAAQHP